MKLLWVFSTFRLGGPQRRFALLAEALGPDYQHHVTAMDGAYDAESALAPGVDYTRAAVSVVKGGFVNPANLRAFRAAIRRIKPDMLLTCNWGAVEWLMANRGPGAAPHIHTEDGFGPDEAAQRNRKRDLTRRILFMDNPFGKARRAYVAPSRNLERIFLDAWRAPKQRVHFIPNGVDVARFAVDRSAPRSGPLTIGAVGLLRREKRYDRLIRVFAQAAGPDARLLLVGDGPERAALEAEAAQLGVAARVEFAGAQPDVAPFLARMDICGLTSDTEQMPLSLIEAMAAGLPLFATDVGDVRDMLGAAQGDFVRPAADEAGLVTAARALLSDAALRQRLGAVNAATAAERYSLETMTRRYRDLFAAVAG